MRIGISWWGICAKFDAHKFIDVNTPDGHRYGRSILVDSLIDQGHDVYAMQPRREPYYVGINYSCETSDGKKIAINDSSSLPDIDVLFIEWRWSTYKNDKTHKDFNEAFYEPDLDRQNVLLRHYKDKCRIIVWDTDHKVTVEDEKNYYYTIIADPSISCRKMTRQRVSLPFWTDFKCLLNVCEPLPIYGYVGNNYERDDEFKKYFFNVSRNLKVHGIQTSLYGNWLQRSPERQPPEALISSNRETSFNHRMNFYDSLGILNKFICTTHVSKESYYESGFISPRYFEALAVNCPALVPKKMLVNDILGKKWVIDSPIDVIDNVIKMKTYTQQQRAEILSEQRYELSKRQEFSHKNVVSFIENLV